MDGRQVRAARVLLGWNLATLADRTGISLSTVKRLEADVADGGDQGPAFQAGVRRVCRSVEVEIVKRSDTAKGFVLLPKRWLVERTIAG